MRFSARPLAGRSAKTGSSRRDPTVAHPASPPCSLVTTISVGRKKDASRAGSAWSIVIPVKRFAMRAPLASHAAARTSGPEPVVVRSSRGSPRGRACTGAAASSAVLLVSGRGRSGQFALLIELVRWRTRREIAAYGDQEAEGHGRAGQRRAARHGRRASHGTAGCPVRVADRRPVFEDHVRRYAITVRLFHTRRSGSSCCSGRRRRKQASASR